MSIYIKEITTLRESFRWLSNKMPEIVLMAENKAVCEKDEDLELMIIPDLEFAIFKKAAMKAYDECPDYVAGFCAEDEYGEVETMSRSEMRGDYY